MVKGLKKEVKMTFSQEEYKRFLAHRDQSGITRDATFAKMILVQHFKKIEEEEKNAQATKQGFEQTTLTLK